MEQGMSELYELWRTNQQVATIQENKVLEYSPDAPILIKKGKVQEWKAIRVQDLNRPNSRALRRLLGLSTSNALDVLPVNYYQSLSDSFWLKKKGDPATWQSIQFTDDRFFTITLTGKGHMTNPEIFKRKESPEHSNTGSFEKGWKKLLNGKWQLWKAGSAEAVWSEVFYSNLANIIFPGCAVKYWEDSTFSVCDNFIDREAGESLEPFYSYSDDHSDPEHALSVLPECVHEDYRKMLFLDALMYNWDRHEFNFGVITKPGTPEIKLQPFYDFNLSLFNGAEPGSTRFKDPVIQIYTKIKTTTPPVTENMVKQAYKNTVTSFPPPASPEDTIDFIMQSYDIIFVDDFDGS
jgi:hypothetical protein